MPQAKEASGSGSTLNDLSGKDWVRHTISWFTLKVRRRTTEEIDHPGKYPDELAERFIAFFTKKGQWVIDPFVGVGSTLVACKNLERNGLGIDINRDFVRVADHVLEQQTLFPTSIQKVICGDALQVDEVLRTHFKNHPPQFDLCMTSPPYWNMLGKQRGGSDSQHRNRKDKGLPLVYSTSIENDIGNISAYDGYLEALLNVFSGLKPFLAAGSHLVVVMQNILDERGRFMPLAWDFSLRMGSMFRLRQEQIWCQTDKMTGIWGYPTTYVSNVHHHYCLVFQNGVKA